MLAAKLLLNQGVEVTCISFVTPFLARRARLRLHSGIPLIVEEISEEHLEMVKNPHYGYGRNMDNPCIDCHAMMFRLAGAIMAEKRLIFSSQGRSSAADESESQRPAGGGETFGLCQKNSAPSRESFCR